MESHFLSPSEVELGENFLKNAFIKQPVEDFKSLERIRDFVTNLTAKYLNVANPTAGFLDHISEYVTPDKLNALKIHIMTSLQNEPWFRHAYFSCARQLLQNLVGNELAMQRNMGFSIQLPNDTNSLLPLHSDVWGSECSAFEVVCWMPLVDCYRTKSIFVLPPESDRVWRKKVAQFENAESLFKAIEPEIKWLDIKFGEVVVFSPTIMHGNRVNLEKTARWSFNIRFKGLFTPYSGKRLGDYFTPISLRPASKLALEFDFPGGFHE